MGQRNVVVRFGHQGRQVNGETSTSRTKNQDGDQGKSMSSSLSAGARAQSISAQASHLKPIAVLIAMPLVMASLGREWLYTPIGYLDPWYNVGFFMFYQDPAFLPDHYKLQRLPWLLPGWALYHTVGPLAANFILHVGALLIATIFV